ncbi:hypothetical protein Hanom_Chr09g00836631 [Helianthus anomalus]
MCLVTKQCVSDSILLYPSRNFLPENNTIPKLIRTDYGIRFQPHNRVNVSIKDVLS